MKYEVNRVALMVDILSLVIRRWCTLVHADIGKVVCDDGVEHADDNDMRSAAIVVARVCWQTLTGGDSVHVR